MEGRVGGRFEAEQVQMVDLDVVSATLDEGAFDDVFQFADVAGEIIVRQRPRGRRVRWGTVRPISVAKTRRKWSAKSGTSSRRWAQGWQLDVEPGQSEIQILPKRAGRDLPAQVGVGRGDDSHVDAAWLVPPIGVTQPSSSTRSTCCAATGMSPILVEKSVPPSASSK